MILQHALDAAQLDTAETEVLRQSDRLQPKPGRLLGAVHVLITREDLAANIGPITSSRAYTGQLIASLTGLPTRLSISTSVSMVNLAVFLFTTSDTRGRETIKISAASACFK